MTCPAGYEVAVQQISSDEAPMTHTRICNMQPLERRRLLAGAHPVAINFNDEAMWDENFAPSVTHAKALGVTAVRVWMGFANYSDRPTAWDYELPFVDREADGQQRQNLAPSVIRSVFKLAREGFSVTLIISPHQGLAPALPEDAAGYVTHLMGVTETPESTQPLRDVVDYWEIGNEIDLGHYWAPSAIDKTAGMQAYVDQFLIPAADVLHAAGSGEKVISAGLSNNADDLRIILNRLKTLNRLDAIDLAGFHPYGKYDPADPTVNQPRDRTLKAKGYADAVGKPLAATEWNIRGFGTAGEFDAKWAQAMDEVYRQVIRPNYDIAFYFTLINNWAGRGGTISARPGGLLKHNFTDPVTPSSPPAVREAFYKATLSPAEPFYSTFKQWQYTTGSISGFLWNDTNGNGAVNSGETRTGVRTVFIDKDGDGVLDSGERSTTSDSQGNYAFTGLSAGTYRITRTFPAGYRISNSNSNALIITLATGQQYGSANIGTTNKAPSLLGSISGMAFNDTNGNGVLNSGESLASGKRIYIDANNNGLFDATEISTLSDSVGKYKLTNLPAGTYRVRRAVPAGYKISTPSLGYYLITLTAGQQFTNANFGSTYA